jgi:hypothetical protein
MAVGKLDICVVLNYLEVKNDNLVWETKTS